MYESVGEWWGGGITIKIGPNTERWLTLLESEKDPGTQERYS